MQPESLDPDDLIGAVKRRGVWRLFAGTVAEWILDYAGYDPSFDSARSEVPFRGHLLVVDETAAEAFLEAMAPYELDRGPLEAFLQRLGSGDWPLSIVLDFDSRHLVNGFAEVPIHDHIPAGWVGIEDCPLDFVPAEIHRIWSR